MEIPAYILVLFLTGSLWTLFFFIFKNLRRELILTSLFIAPLVFIDYFATPGYWTPVTMFNIPVGIEGVIFTFFIAGIASIIFEIVSSRKLNRKKPKIEVKKTLYFIVPGIIALISWMILGFNFIYLVILFLILGSLLINYFRRDLILNSIVSAFVFTCIYVVFFSIWIYLAPHAIYWWNAINLSGIRLGVVPIEEVLFALSFGSFTGPLFEFLTNSKDM